MKTFFLLSPAEGSLGIASCVALFKLLNNFQQITATIIFKVKPISLRMFIHFRFMQNLIHLLQKDVLV